jgi:hypothetical protein
MTIGAVGTIHQIDVLMRQEGQHIMNSFFVQVDSTVDSMETRVLRAILDCFLEILIPASGSNLLVETVRGKEVAPTLGPIYEIQPLATETVQGEATGDTLPSHISLAVNLHTTRGGRSGRGRFFIPGIPEAASQGSFIQTTNPYWTVILAFVACLASKLIHVNEPIGTNQVSWGVMSRKLGGVKPPYLVTGFAPVTRAVARNILGSSNSRKVGRGQ